jgi:hypothetical protein
MLSNIDGDAYACSRLTLRIAASCCPIAIETYSRNVSGSVEPLTVRRPHRAQFVV